MLLDQLKSEDNPKTWTLNFKTLLTSHGLHTGIFRDWGNKGYNEDDQISQSVSEMKEILEGRIVDGSLRNSLNPFVAQFILKNNYGYSDDPKQSDRDDARLAQDIAAHNVRISDARKRAMLEGPVTDVNAS